MSMHLAAADSIYVLWYVFEWQLKDQWSLINDELFIKTNNDILNREFGNAML